MQPVVNISAHPVHLRFVCHLINSALSKKGALQVVARCGWHIGGIELCTSCRLPDWQRGEGRFVCCTSRLSSLHHLRDATKFLSLRWLLPGHGTHPTRTLQLRLSFEGPRKYSIIAASTGEQKNSVTAGQQGEWRLPPGVTRGSIYGIWKHGSNSRRHSIINMLILNPK